MTGLEQDIQSHLGITSQANIKTTAGWQHQKTVFNAMNQRLKERVENCHRKALLHLYVKGSHLKGK